MALPAVANATILASDLYGLCQPSGGTEVGSYYLHGWGNAANDNIGYWVNSNSRAATPVSVSIGTTIQAASNVNAPTTDSLSSSGFHVTTTTTGATINGKVAGLYTITY